MDAASRHYDAGSGLDEHMARCAGCRTGSPCGVGDSVAEAEFRAWRDMQRDDPDSAARHPARTGFGW